MAPGRELTPETRRRVASPPAPFPVIPRAQWLRLAADEADARPAARRREAQPARRGPGHRVVSADKHTGRSRPTLARIMAATGLSRRCVQRWCRWLEAHGLLAVLEQGATPQYRPALYALGKGPQAREWRLTASPVDGTCTPPLVLDLDRSPTRARARDTDKDGRSAADSPAAPSPPQSGSLPAQPKPAATERGPRGRRNSCAVTCRYSAGCQPGRSARPCACISRQAGPWRTSSEPWTCARTAPGISGPTAVHSPARWLAWRLGLWRSADGTPLPPHSAELAARADRHRAGQNAHREQLGLAPGAGQRLRGAGLAGPGNARGR